MSHQEILGKIYGERGYLVIARHKREAAVVIGEIVNDTRISVSNQETAQPLRITSETDLPDFLEQCKFWGGTPIVDPDYNRFYRAEGD